MFYRLQFIINICLTLCLAVTAEVGDFLVNYLTVHLHKALCDNTTHALIAAISWLIVCVGNKYKDVNQFCVEIFVCALIASAIDLDHFLIARSTYLKDATSLKDRPPLHCTTLPVLFCLCLYLVGSWCYVQWFQKVALLVFTAFLSHHVRDANRRGIWFYPFGSTGAIPKWGYIGIICLLPHAIYLVLSRCGLKPTTSKEYFV